MTIERKHTEGPWTVARAAYVDMPGVDKITVVSESARQVVCKVGDSNHPAVLPDAALIARAPELVAEVERLTAQRDELLDAVDAALDDLNGGKHYDAQYFLAAAYGRIRKEIDTALAAKDGAGK